MVETAKGVIGNLLELGKNVWAWWGVDGKGGDASAAMNEAVLSARVW